MEDILDMQCDFCGYLGLANGLDGYYYCLECNCQDQNIMDTGNVDENFLAKQNLHGPIYQPIQIRHYQKSNIPSMKVQDSRHSQFWSKFTDPHQPSNSGSTDGLSYEDFYNEVRNRYVMGVQIMIQSQCEVLVEKFKVTPLICGMVGPIWLRFMALSRVFSDNWADKAIQESEINITQGKRQKSEHCSRQKEEPKNLYGERAVTIWLRCLKKSIPLSSSLAICFLVCHLAREAILPTDIIKWSIEGTIPYFAAFVDIEKQMGVRSRACPISARIMFRPSQIMSSENLEAQAASVANTVGLYLPPVNFPAIASRYLKQLSLPDKKIFDCVFILYEWMMPSELYLSLDVSSRPTRVCVLSVIIVAIRIRYGIHGFGFWERSLLSTSNNHSSSATDKDQEISEFHAEELLKKLEAKYYDLGETYEFSKDLLTYLKFCKNIVFAGEEQSFIDNEYKLIQELWDFYEKEQESKVGKVAEELHESIGISERICVPSEHSKLDNHEAIKDRAVRRLKKDMEENRFYYIPPRKFVKSSDYLHYVRKKVDGVLSYVAHADYYILLRACAKIGRIDVRVMHDAVLYFEKKLAWLEKRIDSSLHVTFPKITCEFCSHPEDGASSSKEGET